MTLPICPACRAPIAMDAHVCGRCGLAVRPTCANCGEALEVRMHACPRCWELIEHPHFVAEGSPVVASAEATAPAEVTTEPVHTQAAPQHYVPAAPATTMTYEQAPVATLPVLPPAFEPPRSAGFRVVRVIFIGLLAGIVAALLLLALEAVGPRLRGTLPEQQDLVRQGFGHLAFAISVPEEWEADEEAGGEPSAVFREAAAEGEDGPRSLRVVLEDRSLSRARELAETASAPDYDEINIVGGLRIDGRPAVRHRFTLGDDYRERWWIERGDGTYRLEFSAPLSRQEESAELFVRVARTFDVL